MVCIHLIIIGLQAQNFPASRLHSMIAFVVLAMVRSTCYFHRRGESSMRPRYLTILIIFNSLPHKDKFLRPGRDLRPVNVTMVVFEGLMFNPTAPHHPFARPSHLCMMSQIVSTNLLLAKIHLHPVQPHSFFPVLLPRYRETYCQKHLRCLTSSHFHPTNFESLRLTNTEQD